VSPDPVSEIDQSVAASGNAQLTNVLQVTGNGNIVMAVVWPRSLPTNCENSGGQRVFSAAG
jgi:hypothetical protein